VVVVVVVVRRLRLIYTLRWSVIWLVRSSGGRGFPPQIAEVHGLGFGLGHTNQSAYCSESPHGGVDVIFEVMDTCDCVGMGKTCRKAEIIN
jgi:hypothetical protein